MSNGSPFRYKSYENRTHYSHLSTVHDSVLKVPTVERVVYKENDYDWRARSRSPVRYEVSHSYGGARYVQEAVRHSQVVNRYAIVPPVPVTVQHENVVKTIVSQHQEFFVSELQSEVNELRSRQRDYASLRDQYNYLIEQYKHAQIDKQHFENDCLARISEDRQEVDRLIRELDNLKSENVTVENEQSRLLETISITEREIITASSELADLRHSCSAEDIANLNLRKEIEFQEGLCNEQKEIIHMQYGELTKLRDVSFQLDKEIDNQHKRLHCMRNEAENNEKRIVSITNLIASKDEQIHRTVVKISEAHAQIQDLKYNLNKLDGELGYYENQNEQHKAAQGQLFRANDHEYTMSKENSLKVQELSVVLNRLESEEKSLAYEIDRLKQHSDQMMRDQVDLQAEIDALDKHMATLNNQNYCLQKELEEFVEADEQVRLNLNRKQKVESIRSRVDDVIRRSQAEVENRFRAGSKVVTEVVQHSPVREVVERRVIGGAKSATHYSPSRTEYVTQQRVAWKPLRETGNIVKQTTTTTQFGGPTNYSTSTNVKSYSPIRNDRGRSGGKVTFA